MLQVVIGTSFRSFQEGLVPRKLIGSTETVKRPAEAAGPARLRPIALVSALLDEFPCLQIEYPLVDGTAVLMVRVSLSNADRPSRHFLFVSHLSIHGAWLNRVAKATRKSAQRFCPFVDVSHQIGRAHV